jgi:cytidylate kinase
MRYRILTLSNEFGSGGAHVARHVADRLGWRLLDSMLIDTLQERAGVDPEVAQRYDQAVDAWIERLSRAAVPPDAAPTTEAEPQTAVTRRVVLEAAEIGGCVIVGRGAQCLLAGRADTLHVFVYGPREARLEFLRERLGEQEDLNQAVATVDHERADYVRLHYGCDLFDRNLYDLMVNGRRGVDFAAQQILSALGHGE